MLESLCVFSSKLLVRFQMIHRQIPFFIYVYSAIFSFISSRLILHIIIILSYFVTRALIATSVFIAKLTHSLVKYISLYR